MRTESQRFHCELETTVSYVTHDQAEAMTMSGRIAVLSEGRLQQIAPPLECYNAPANRFVAGCIGSPTMNFVEGELVADGLETSNFRVDLEPDELPRASVGDTITRVIRPEDISTVDQANELPGATDQVDTRTDVLEPMGDEVVGYLLLAEEAGRSMAEDPATAPDQLLVTVLPDTESREEQDIEVVLDRSKVHLFVWGPATRCATDWSTGRNWGPANGREPTVDPSATIEWPIVWRRNKDNPAPNFV
ncbi:glycerol-3-phosphate-transporting ATPase [Natronobacterium gregoryi SP2]|uniref:Glycerol-3-phosphate-transporting ATPase n=2 Tax=Natronobacterium gregoryi TaxID=44930 RepID=L9Y3C2_NATGS|nr:glycerol-3-phosphate-transporting ATPase [Natronobacterium gregoryi SP2]